MRGSLSDAVLAALPDLTPGPCGAGCTVLIGPVRDDSDVLSVMARWGDFGLSVIEMRQLPD